MPRNAPARARLGAPLVVVLLSLTACGGGNDSPAVTPDPAVSTTVAGGSAAATILAVTVRGGSVVEGAARQKVGIRKTVTIRVTSDAADEVHVHGYDKMIEVIAGRPAEVTFVANIPGVFEVEFEKSHKLLFTMEVS